MSAECAFCFGNFKIRGTKHTSVLLFTGTNNKEIVALIKGLNVDTVTLSVLLSHICIKLQKDKFNCRSLCKKCAWKVTSMYNTFMEICEAVKKNDSLSSQVGMSPSSSIAHCLKRQHFFSPTVLGPHAKTTIRSMKSNKNVRKRLNLASAASGHGLNYNISEQEDVIANLMNLPVAEDETKLVPIVKVRSENASFYKLQFHDSGFKIAAGIFRTPTGDF